MDKISFLLDNTVVLATVSKKSEHVIKFACSEALPAEPVLLSGFNILNEHNGNNMTGNYYHSYTTIYKNIDSKIVLLSNDGSVYVDKNDVDDNAFESIEPHVETLEEAKRRKIIELSNTCKKSIITGVDVKIDNDIEHFSYSDEDQINIKELFDLTYQTSAPVYYHADGGTCKSYTSAQFISIYSAEVTNKMHHTTYFNQLKMYVMSLNTIDDVNIICYGQELTGQFLNTYNNAMLQAKENLIALLANRIIANSTETESE